MTEPRQPADPPTEGGAPDANPSGTTPGGKPDGLEEFEPMGRPNSDRQKTETAG